MDQYFIHKGVNEYYAEKKYGYATFYLSIHCLIEIWAISTLW